MSEQRDQHGRLRVPFFIDLILKWIAEGNVYGGHAAQFKRHVEQLGALVAGDWDPEINGYPKWKHRVDRAAQKVFTDI